MRENEIKGLDDYPRTVITSMLCGCSTDPRDARTEVVIWRHIPIEIV
jgi:hypothetical protein